MSTREKAVALVTGAVVSGAAVYALYSAARGAHEAGLPHLAQLAPFVDIDIDKAPLYEVRDGEVRNIEALQDVVIVWGGIAKDFQVTEELLLKVENLLQNSQVL